MPNPVAVNDYNLISGSLQTSRISYGVETAGKNYGQNFNSSYWYSDIPNNGLFYTIISDNYTANYYISRSNAGGAYVEGGLAAVDDYSAPVFWVTPGTSSLDIITTVNGLPDRVGQIPFNSGSQALNWIASSSNYFAVGPDYYAQIDADNLRFYVDANQIISYPTTMSAWYDLSGYGTNSTLGDDITFDPRGWMEFNGTQNTDYNIAVPISRGELGNTMSIEATFQYKGNSGDTYRPIIGGNDPGSGTEFFLGKTTGTNNFGVQDGNFNGAFATTPNVFDGRWHHMIYTYDNNTGKLYLDGILRNTGTFTKCNDAEQIYIGAEVQEGYWWHGNISQTKYYIKTLTAADVAQNYYGGPIVTNGLVFAIDAGNLVSYPKSGTTAYDLTGNTNANLRNGTGFSSKDGGTWTFDGTDDLIDVSGVYDFSISQAVTVECWAQSDNPLWNDNGYLVSRRPQFIIHPQFGTNQVGFYVRIGGSFSFVDVVISDITKWHHYVLTYDGNDLKAYVDGIFRGSTSPGPGLDSDTGVVEIGKDDSFSRFLDGSIASVRLYDIALTAAEVLQNYNATQ